jgi:hypothetical protein
MNIEILNWRGPPWKGDWGKMKRFDRDEPIRVMTHISMETAQGISLCDYVYLKLAKMLCFSFYLLCFLLQN